MKSHRKPDLLFMLVVFVGVGFIISSYIQYTNANANAEKSIPLAADKGSTVPAQNASKNVALAAPGAKTDDTPALDPVNNSPK